MFGDAGFLAQPPAGGPAQKAMDELVQSAVAVLRHFHAPEKNAKALAIQMWSMTHGVAELMLAGHFRDSDVGAADVLESGVAALIEAGVRNSLGVQGLFPPQG
jgi:hypothetical protein